MRGNPLLSNGARYLESIHMHVLFWSRVLACGAVLRHQIRATSMASESLDTFFAPPSCVRGLKELDRDAFKRDVVLPAVQLEEASLCGKFLKRLAHVVLAYPSTRKVIDVREKEGGKEKKAILLTPEQFCKSPLTPDDHQWITDNGGKEITHILSLDYSYFSKYAILRAILPPEIVDVPTGFEQVGHIAHLNLREETLPFKKIIGQVILDKQSSIRTVINKIDSIDNTFRFFKMEILAGEDDFVATVKENDCNFTFDFSKVYWNSRLISEHKRIVDLLQKDDIVLDVFAGVGPFAVPAARKGCTVYANDLNPHSYTYLCENAKKNGVTRRLVPYNMDGREFIRTLTKELVKKAFPESEAGGELSSSVSQTKRTVFSQVVMNLPASAVQFLDTFKGLFAMVPKHLHGLVKMPMVHCYCFVKFQEPEHQDPALMVAKHLGISELKEGSYSVFTVRHVAPNKDMMRVSFEMPPEVIFTPESPWKPNDTSDGITRSKDEEGSCTSVVVGDEPTPKRARLDN